MPILYAVFPKEYGRYIEVCGGSGAVLLGKPEDKFEVHNDLDGELVNLFRVVRDRSEEFLLELGLLPLNSREEFAEWVRFHTGGRTPEVYLPTQMEIWDKLCPRPEVVDYVKQVLRQRMEHREVLQAAVYFKRMRTSYASSGRSFACQPFNISIEGSRTTSAPRQRQKSTPKFWPRPL